MTNTARRFILENKQGQKVRAFLVEGSEMTLIYRHDTRRVELHSDLSFLEESEISFDKIKKTSVSTLERSSVDVAGVGRLRLAKPNELLDGPSHELAKDTDDEKLPMILKKTAIGHAVAVVLLMGLTGLMAFLNQKPEEPQLVTIVVPEKKESQPVQHVKASEKKVIEKNVPKNVKVADRTVKPKTTQTVKKVVQKTPQVKRQFHSSVRNAPERSMERVGALAALGGLKNGTRGAEGLDANSLRNIRSAGVGSGGGGVGGAGAGGIKGMMPGTGLIAGSAGSGGRAESAGGYGTKGVGGGKAGYGKISLVGGTSGLILPLDEEAMVEGGLDMDSILAVIRRNMGQITYCYEQGLQAQPALRGRVSISWTIGGGGRITTLKVAQTSLGSKIVESCMVAKMRGWQFPKPKGNVNVDVQYPFAFQRVTSR